MLTDKLTNCQDVLALLDATASTVATALNECFVFFWAPHTNTFRLRQAVSILANGTAVHIE